MLDDEINRMLQDLNQQLSYQGMNLDMYMQYMQQDLATLREQVKPDAEKTVKSRIVLQNIVDAEGIDVAEEEVEEELKTMAAQYQMEVEKLKELLGVESITYLAKDIKVKKAVDFLFDNAVIK